MHLVPHPARCIIGDVQMAIKNTFTHIFPLPWLQVNEMPELKRWVSFASFMHLEVDFLEVPF